MIEQRAAVLPLHIAEGELACFVLRRREGNLPAAGCQLAGDAGINRHTGHRRTAIGSTLGLLRHFLQRFVCLQQRHGIIGRHIFRFLIGHGKIIRAERCQVGVIVICIAAVEKSGVLLPLHRTDVNGFYIFLANFIHNRVIRYIRLRCFDFIRPRTGQGNAIFCNRIKGNFLGNINVGKHSASCS